MKIIVTYRDILDKGMWSEACELLGLNPYAINEGRLDAEEERTLTYDQAKVLRFLS